MNLFDTFYLNIPKFRNPSPISSTKLKLWVDFKTQIKMGNHLILLYICVVQRGTYTYTDMNLFNIAGDLGGSLGFYLGGSCLTLMEIADILFIKFIAKRIQIGSTPKTGQP